MNRDEKYTVIVGCGRLGASLANAISDAEGSVMMVDRDERAFRKLDAAYGGLTLVGDATDVAVLRSAQIERADTVGDGRLSVAEVTIPEGAPAADKKLWEINLPGEVIVGCILRKDQTLIPRGDTRILAGDTLVLLSSAHQETAAIHELTGR